jgi:hypothetical protein
VNTEITEALGGLRVYAFLGRRERREKTPAARGGAAIQNSRFQIQKKTVAKQNIP